MSSGGLNPRGFIMGDKRESLSKETKSNLITIHTDVNFIQCIFVCVCECLLV